MNIPINVAAATHLDNKAKEKAREVLKKIEQSYEYEICNCDYKSPFKDCPNCGPEYWETTQNIIKE
jgi:hypothetical protein